MRTRAYVFVFLLALLSALPASRLVHASKTPAASQANIPFRIVDRGILGLCDEPCYYTITEAAQWTRFWTAQNTHLGTDRTLPPIDFSREMVIVTGMGGMPSSGYTITVSKITATRGRLSILVKE